jgi:beta-glucosidase
MDNRTYRYFKGQPLYPVGYGLSYTTFSYDALKMPPQLTSGKGATVSVRVTNTGAVDGEEVVQLYVASSTASNKQSIRELKGFKRIFLKKGESKVVTFTLKPESLAVMDEKGKPKFYKGKITIAVGGCQPNEQSNSSKKTVQGIVSIK